MEILLALAGAFALLSVAFLGLARRAYKRRRWMGTAGRSGGAALCLSLSALAGTLAASTQGYRALTREEVAATVTTLPTGPGAFQAYVEFPDGRDTTLAVRGDQLLVDAHILKWHYLANVIGLHTQYELDRLTGRYVDITDEQTRERTVHSLKSDKPVDLFDLVERFSFLTGLVDAEYGSATFIDVDEPARFEILVSTTGLLVREVGLR
ncbi:MAG: hypothetical protein R3253_09595 [Longimicrobiales bacterium]|nr:hypothetical protein [Longimicrobiales bacterium]